MESTLSCQCQTATSWGHRLCLFLGAQLNNIPQSLVPSWSPQTTCCHSDMSRSDGSLPARDGSEQAILLLTVSLTVLRLRVHSGAMHSVESHCTEMDPGFLLLRHGQTCTHGNEGREGRNFYLQTPRNRRHRKPCRATWRSTRVGQGGGGESMA